MTTVVTGATGHVGANLIRALLAQCRSVRALVHLDRRGIEDLDVEVIEGNVCDLDSLCRIFQGAEVVYHLTAHISLLMNEWPRCQQINVGGVRNVVEACLRCDVKRLVHFSSIHAVCTADGRSALDEASPYVKKKGSADIVV